MRYFKEGLDEITLPKNQQAIQSLEEYINAVTKVKKSETSNYIVFRGESSGFPTPCQPNLFRNPRYLEENFERNLLDQLRSHKILNFDTCIELAMAAQHGAFPSRLLDVSFNSLVALYFATSENKPQESASESFQDGYVYILEFDEMFSASSQYAIELYDCYINYNTNYYKKGDKVLLAKLRMFEDSHKLIDSPKQNDRIIAQQGAFFLFPGYQYQPLHHRYFRQVLRISNDHKPAIQKELETYFGINRSYLFPDADNEKSYVIEKTENTNNKSFSWQSEVDYYYASIKRNVEFSIKELEQARKIPEAARHVSRIEHYLEKYRINYLYSKKMLGEPDNNTTKSFEDSLDLEHNKFHSWLTQRLANVQTLYLEEYPFFIDEFGIDIRGVEQ